MESDIYYINFENETQSTTPPPLPSRRQDAGKDKKCKGSRCLVLMVVCSWLICLLLLGFIILQQILVTAERESMSKNQKDIIQVFNQTLSRFQDIYSDLMTVTAERESMSKNQKDTVQVLNQTISRFQDIYSNLRTEKEQLQDRFNILNYELKKSYDNGYQWGSGWFFKSNVSKTWSESKQYCRDQGADLVIIKSEAKQNILTSVISGRESVWIGLTDAWQEGNMRWMDDSPLKQGFWQDGEPNNHAGNEDCVELVSSYSSLNNWNDQSCLSTRKAICEKY